ncbi:MAG: hypothetical protein K2X35_14355 [Bryobacteraceae bacterium]|nr:hypothetical protein [Bryobacteraceae bacterium]
MLRRFVALAIAVPLLGHDPAHDQLWLEDLTALHTELPRRHPNLFSKMTRKQFDDAAVALAAAIPQLSNPEIITRMAAMIAMAGDSHTWLNLSQKDAAMARFPLQFRWFSDGLFVVAAAPEYRNAIGTRVLKVGGYDTDAVFRQLKTLISHENEFWARQISRDYFASADTLAALRVIPSAANATFELLTVNGSVLNVSVASMPSTAVPALEFAPASHGSPLPLYRQNAGRNYWWTYLEPLRLLYLKYTVCRNEPDRPFAQVAQEFLAAFDSRPVRKVVIDFRANGGGDSSVINPLLEGLQQRQHRLLEGVRAYALIDNGVFSSGMMNAANFAGQRPYAFVVGEPTGGKPVHFGNVSTLTLPNSRLAISYSTRFFDSPIKEDAVIPDIPVTLSSADYFARHDPVLAAVLAGSPGDTARWTGNVATFNGASFRDGAPIAGGSLATVFGDFSSLPSGDAAAVPLPRSLNGVELKVGGRDAPLIAVRAGQINFQVPRGLAEGTAPVLVSLNGRSIGEGAVQIAATAPGLFPLGVTMGRQGAVLNQNFSVNGEWNPALPGEIVQIFGTGAGAVTPEIADGAAAPRLTETVARPQVLFGTQPAEVVYSGMSNQFPGFWQMNVRVPAGASGATPVFVIQGSQASNGITVAVR